MMTVSPGPPGDPRRRISAAAATCFARSGFQGASMQEICLQAGMSAGSLYRYFPSKAAIILEIAEAEREQHAVLFESLDSSDDPLSALADIADAFLRIQLDGDTNLLTAEIVAEAARNPEVREAFEAKAAMVRDRIAAALRRGQATGRVDPGADVEAACHILMSLGDCLGSRRGCLPAVDTPRILSSMRTLMFRFLRPSPAGETVR